MCIILVKPVGVKALSKEWIQNGLDANTDGYGCIVRTADGQLIVNKGFDDKEAIQFATSFGEEVDVVFHARIGTSGVRDESNLHPFPIYSNPQDIDKVGAIPVAYLLHNGIMTGLPEWDKTKNDTWHLARIWEASYGPSLTVKMRQRGWRRRQKKRLGSYNKFVLVDTQGVSIINPLAGKWVEGVWHSNDSALYAPYLGSAYDWYDAEGWDYVQNDDGTWKRVWESKEKCSNKLVLPSGSGYTDFRKDNFSYDDADEEFIRNLEAQGGDVNSAVAQLRREYILDQWRTQATVEAIEETIFEYASEDIAGAVRELLRQSGYTSRLGSSE